VNRPPRSRQLSRVPVIFLLVFVSIFFVSILGTATCSYAQEPVKSQTDSPANGIKNTPDTRFRRLAKAIIEPIRQEFLEIERPVPERRKDVHISLRPRLEELLTSEYVHSPILVKYGLAKNIEVSATPQTYFTNFTRRDFRMEIANLDLGLKYRFLHILRQEVSMAFSFHALYPLGNNPDMMDGYIHYKPALIASKKLPYYHKLEIVGSIGLDIVDGAGSPLIEEQERKDRTTYAVALALPRDPYTYTLELVHTTDRPAGGDLEVTTLTPGWHWAIPERHYDWFPGRLGVSVGVRLGIHGAPDTEVLTAINMYIPFGVRVNVDPRKEDKVKWEFYGGEELSESWDKIKDNSRKLKERTLDFIKGDDEEPAPAEPAK